MCRSLRTFALLAASAAAAILAGRQTINAEDRVWPPAQVQQDDMEAPRLGFMGYFNGSGERVVRVRPGSLAWDIGLEPRDVIVAVNGVRLQYDGHWYELMADAAYRGRATLSIRDWRTGRIVRRHVDFGGGDMYDGTAHSPAGPRSGGE